MNEETKDQGQEETQTGQTSEKQSETTSGETEKELFELPDGRKVDASTLSKEWKENFYPEFTRRSQKLAEIDKASKETEARNKKSAEESVAQNELLKDVDPTVRDAIVSIIMPVLDERDKAKERAEEQKRDKEAFDKELITLEKKYPGKFNRIEILKEMQKPENRIYDPEILFQVLHQDTLLDEKIKAAMKGKESGIQTENTSTEAPKKPGDSTPPTTFGEATKRAAGRF